jgi:hypothetical protein
MKFSDSMRDDTSRRHSALWPSLRSPSGNPREQSSLAKGPPRGRMLSRGRRGCLRADLRRGLLYLLVKLEGE